MVLPAGPDAALQNGSASANLRVLVYEVELGQKIFIPVPNVSFHLINAPQFASVVNTRPDGLEVRGEKMGETLMLIWSAGGVQSVRVRVLRPSIEVKSMAKLIAQSSPVYRSQQNRTFHVSYESAYALLNEGTELGRVSESRKLYGQQIKAWGSTPFGLVRSGLFYEYRKEHALQKAVSIPRDFYYGLYESDLPFVKRYDLVGGTQYTALSRFGFPGARYNGFSLQPSISRWSNPKKGQTDFSWFIGHKRDGSIIDNPAGVQNRQIRGNVAGERVDHYFWPGGKTSVGAYHEWGGPRTEFEAKNNFDGHLDFRFPHVQLESEGGFDQQQHGAGEIRGVIQNRFAGFQTRYYDVNSHYATITGGVENRANRGIELDSNLFPLLPLWNSDAVSLRGSAGWVRNHLSINPQRPKDYIKWQRGDVMVKLPWHLTSDTEVAFFDQRAASFPFTQKRFFEEVSRSFSLNNRLISRLRLSVFSGEDLYRNSQNSPGFNSTRSELGASANLNFRSGFWTLTRFGWNYLREEDQPTPPHKVTHPTQLTLAAGWSHTFQRLPVPISLDADIRYIEEGDTRGKIHQPYVNENRLEAHGGITIPLRANSQWYADARIASTQSAIGAQDHAELSIITGVRMLLDSKFYIAQKGMVEGYVFDDRNANGIHDPGEPGLMGHEVYVEGAGRTKTNAEGYYRLKIKEGTAKVVASTKVPEGFFYTTVNWKEMEILPKSKTRMDFGLAAQFEIRGRAFVDVNQNGIFENGDIPISKVRIALATGQSGTTAPDGFYSILRIPPGSNQIRVLLESIPEGYRTETAIERKIDAASGDLMHFDIILKPLRALSGCVFEDLNQNHVKEPDEPGIPNAQIDIQGRTVRTGRGGRYQMSDLAAGKTEVRLTLASLPPGYKPIESSHTLEISQEPFRRTDVDFPVRKSFQKN